MTRNDTHEIVVNWSSGNNVHIEVVPIVALTRPTRKLDSDMLQLFARVDASVTKGDPWQF